jgi:hypothetical protein
MKSFQNMMIWSNLCQFDYRCRRGKLGTPPFLPRSPLALFSASQIRLIFLLRVLGQYKPAQNEENLNVFADPEEHAKLPQQQLRLIFAY